jgi:hypothetical protein
MAQGTIKRLTDRGFGFIDQGTREDLFFHGSALQNVHFNDLRPWPHTDCSWLTGIVGDACLPIEDRLGA